MKRSIVRVSVRLLVEHQDDVTEEDLQDIANEMDYEISHDDNQKRIADTEIISSKVTNFATYSGGRF